MAEIKDITEARKKILGNYFDYSMLFMVIFLLGFGLLMVYSASSYTSEQSYGDAAYYLKRQFIADVLGIIAMFVVMFIPYKFWSKFPIAAYAISIVSIILIIPFGIESHGAKRWLKVAFGFNVQPAEIAKLCMIVVLAVVVAKMGKGIRAWKGFFVAIGWSLPIAALIRLITNNMSSALIVVGIAFLMVFVASPDYKKFILMVLAGAALFAVLVLVARAGMSNGNFRFGRLAVWLDPESQAQGQGFQVLQGLYAIGSGGIFGKGLGESMQKINYLPEAQNDMIFSVVCEELGIFGAFGIMLIFLLLLWRMMIVAQNAKDSFGLMLVVGVMAHIAIQVMLNIAVVSNSIPNTGVSLPFISYGGSSVLFLMAEIGLVFSVARGIEVSQS
ncbi:MAG: cell division protein FtsW [Lachnospiraceae bacterium]|nr:cell division protein FtsW [Lachnospiraceae bacterium]